MSLFSTTTRRIAASVLALGLAGSLAPTASAQNTDDALKVLKALSSEHSKPGTPGKPHTPGKPGTPAAGTVRLTDQKAAGSRYVNQNKQVMLGGKTYENSLESRGSFIGNFPYVDYALSKEFRTLETTIGVSDHAQYSNQKLVVKFIGDNKVIATHEVVFPNTKKISVNVKDVTRLRIEFYAYENSTGKAQSWAGGVLASPTLTR